MGQLRIRFLVCLLALSVICLSADTSLFGQETGGEITGIVKDATSAVIPGATVKITNKTTARVTTITSREDGSYRARGLEPGRYSVRFEMGGFSPVEVTDAELLLGKTLTLDATMRVGAVQQAVTVVEATPLVDLSGTATGHNIPAEEFQELPKGRSFQGLLNLSPSVMSGQDQFGNVVGLEGGLQVNGASAAENQFVIDGVSTNSAIYGQSRQNATFEYLQEVQVKT